MIELAFNCSSIPFNFLRSLLIYVCHHCPLLDGIGTSLLCDIGSVVLIASGDSALVHVVGIVLLEQKYLSSGPSVAVKV